MADPEVFSRYTSTSALASGYTQEESLNWAKSYFRAHYTRHLPLDRSAAILEVGCGYGGNLQALAEMGYGNCHGIDLSAEQIAHARSVLNLTNVEEADAVSWLDGKLAAYDCILALDVFEHLTIEQLLVISGRIREALKPGGRLIVQVPNGTTLINPYVYGDLTHLRAFTPQSLRQLFLLSGLRPRGFYETPPHIHGLRSLVRRALWSWMIKPAVAGLMAVVKGRVVGGHIYTLNLIAVAERADHAAVPCDRGVTAQLADSA